MSSRLSAKVILVLAAFAFVVAFRIHAGENNESAPRTATLSAARATALTSDAGVRPAPPAPAVPGLRAVAPIPALAHLPARRHVKQKPAPPKAPAQPAAPTPVPTATPVAVAPAAPAIPKPKPKPKKSYVGKDFDTSG